MCCPEVGRERQRSAFSATDAGSGQGYHSQSLLGVQQMDFKNALIASSAIVAVGGLGLATADAAKKPKLKISGYYEMFAGIADGDRSGNTVDGTPTYQGDGFNEEGNFAIVHYGEIRFKASGKTDSGMKWGVYFEDVQDDSDADGGGEKLSTDETNLWLSGSWGKLVLGGQGGDRHADADSGRRTRALRHYRERHCAVRAHADD